MKNIELFETYTAGERIAQLVATGSMDLAREAARVAISSAVKLFLQGG